jgi:hypothetical protein
MNKVLTQTALCPYKIYGNKLHFVPLCFFPFCLSAIVLYYCEIKKLNSISDSLLCFSYLCLSLCWTIYKGTPWHPMRVLSDDFLFFPPLVPILQSPLCFIIFSISYCHFFMDFVCLPVFCSLKGGEKVDKNARLRNYLHLCI